MEQLPYHPFAARKVTDDFGRQIAADVCAQCYGRDSEIYRQDGHIDSGEQDEIEHVHQIHAVALLTDVLYQGITRQRTIDSGQNEEEAEGEQDDIGRTETPGNLYSRGGLFRS